MTAGGVCETSTTRQAAPAFLPSSFLSRSAPRRAPRRCPRRTAPACKLRLSPAPAAAYAVYLPYIFGLSSAHAPGLPPQNSLLEAAQLSLNFDYVLPLALPRIAPVLHPAFEAIFTVTVSFAALLVGFAADVPHTSADGDAEADVQSEDEVAEADGSGGGLDITTLAVLAVPFLTNIIWLPYLALRPSLSATTASIARRPKLLLRISQSPILPLYAVLTVLASLPYFLYARAETYTPGLTARLAELSRLVHDNILANSFAADMVMFALFQGWLARDDAAARGWTGARRDGAVRAASVLPFFGLAWYLLERARDPNVRQF